MVTMKNSNKGATLTFKFKFKTVLNFFENEVYKKVNVRYKILKHINIFLK